MQAAKLGDHADAWRPWRPRPARRAQYHLGMLYEDGRRVGSNYAEADRWFTLAARAGNGFGRRNLERLWPMLSPAESAEGEAPPDGSE